MKRLLQLLIISFAVFAIASPGFAGDDRDDRNWDRDNKEQHHHSEKDKHHHKSRVLVVDQEKGTVDVGDTCPAPRTSEKYSEIQAASQCAESGDIVRIKPGVYFTEFDCYTDRCTFIGSGINQTISYSTGGVGPNQFVEVKNMTFQSITSCFDDGIIGVERGGKLTIRNSMLTGGNCEIAGAVGNRGRLKIFDSILVGNIGTFGAAIANRGGDLKIVRTTLVNNVGVLGGAIYNSDEVDSGGNTHISSVKVIQSLISGNEGGGIYNESIGKVKVVRTVLEANEPGDCIGCP